MVMCSTNYLVFWEGKVSEPFDVPLSQNGVQRVDIIVDSYLFKPDHIIVSVDKPVEITLISVTRLISHNFILNIPEAGLSIKKGVGAGKDVTFTFIPTKTGKYEFYCGKKGLFGSHRKKGMEGILEVK